MNHYDCNYCIKPKTKPQTKSQLLARIASLTLENLELKELAAQIVLAKEEGEVVPEDIVIKALEILVNEEY